MLRTGEDNELAIDAWQFERDHVRDRWLRATNEVAAALRVGSDTGDGLDLLVQRARQIAGAVVAGLAIPDGPEHLVFQACDTDNAMAGLLGARIPIMDSIAGDVFSTGRSRVVHEVSASAAARSSETVDGLPVSIAALGPGVFVPLRTGPHPRGVLLIARPHTGDPFDEDDLRMIDGYAEQAAMAMDFAEAQFDRQRLAVFEERDRIARDLHDLVIQRLFAIGIGMQSLTRGTLDADEVAERVGTYVSDIDQTIREIRRSIFSLQEPANGPYSLRRDVLRAISDATVSLGYEPTVRLEGPLESVVPPEMHLDLIATLRESLSNVVRHAHATCVQVTVAVDRCATRLELVVQDDGVGIPAELAHRSGLANMAQRARRWSGDCVIDTPASGGTRVDWFLPLPRRQDTD